MASDTPVEFTGFSTKGQFANFKTRNAMPSVNPVTDGKTVSETLFVSSLHEAADENSIRAPDPVRDSQVAINDQW